MGIYRGKQFIILHSCTIFYSIKSKLTDFKSFITNEFDKDSKFLYYRLNDIKMYKFKCQITSNVPITYLFLTVAVPFKTHF